MFQAKAVEKIKTYISYSIYIYFLNHTIYEIMWKNIVEPGRPQITMWHMCIACCICKATNKHQEYVALIAFPLQQWLHECALMLHFKYIACLVQ